ncbi:MAG: transposase [Bacteroidetes bacterium]|nr:transposase [Bacteroidota bacterium]
MPPQSLIGKALAYSLSRWEKLMLYCTDGRLEIDNNLVENAIRPVAIGRKITSLPVLMMRLSACHDLFYARHL